MEELDLNEVSLERRRIGLELNQSETAIGIGRRALKELFSCENIDERAVAEQKQNVLEARLARNELRIQLDQVKRREPVWLRNM